MYFFFLNYINCNFVTHCNGYLYECNISDYEIRKKKQQKKLIETL